METEEQFNDEELLPPAVLQDHLIGCPHSTQSDVSKDVRNGFMKILYLGKMICGHAVYAVICEDCAEKGEHNKKCPLVPDEDHFWTLDTLERVNMFNEMLEKKVYIQ